MFKLFSRASRAQEPSRNSDLIGCFGKLPIHPDFVRHGVSAREVAAFENWVQEGVGLISRRFPGGWPDACRNFPRHHFALAGGEQDRTLVGTLVASSDSSGRKYPFLLFTLPNDLTLRESPAVLPLVFEEFFLASERLCAENWGREPVSLLVDRVDALPRRNGGQNRRTLLEQQIDLLSRITMGCFWERALPGSRQEDVNGMFNVLLSALRTVARRKPARVPWGVRLPIPDEENQGAYVVFWVQLVTAILEERSWRMQYFWCRAAGERRAALTVFFRPLPASYLLSLLQPEMDDGSVFDVVSERRQPSDFCSGAELQRLYAGRELSMLDFLYRVGRREVLA